MTEEIKAIVDEAVRHIARRGPDRVVVDDNGTGMRPRQTAIRPDVYFIRKDGWSLGAPKQFANVAYGMWLSEWAAYLEKGSALPKEIRHWTPLP